MTTTAETKPKPKEKTVIAAVASPPKASPDAKPKKRKRATSPAKRKTAKAAVGAVAETPPPSHILVIDNGGDTLKYGIVGQNETPESLPNVTARLRHQWTVLVGDELDTVQPTQIETSTRCLERGCITNLGNQVQVWKRLLDKLRIQVPLTSEAAQSFGWKVSRQPTNKQSPPLFLPQTMAVVLMVSPLCPRSILDQIFAVWFQDFGFAHVGIVTSPAFGSITDATPTECCLVVDCGWSATQVVPTCQNRILSSSQQQPSSSIRRLPLGGRHLIGLWKYYCSYRQWNLMDADFLLQDVHHALAYVSLQFKEELRVAQTTTLGRRPFDREFVLPDFQTTHKGFARLTPQLRRIEDEAKEEEAAAKKQEEKEKKAEEDAEDDDKNVDDDESDDGSADGTGDSDEDEEVDSDNETDEQKRKRLVKQREAEERRRREVEAERQVLLVSVERFTIPEVLFHPSDAGLGAMAGLPQTILASVQACPRIYQSALYGSIRLIGGMSKLENLKERLYRELRMLVPTQYELAISVADDPINEAWIKAKSWVQETPHAQWSISRDEFDASLKTKDVKKQHPWHRLLDAKIGKFV